MKKKKILAMRGALFPVSAAELSYFIILFSFVRIEALIRLPFVDLLYDGLKLLGFLLIGGLYCRTALKTNRIKPNMFNVAFAVLVIVTFVSTLVHGNNIVVFIVRYLPWVTSMLLVEYLCLTHDGITFFRSAAKLFSILLWANFLGLLVAPGGFYVTGGRSMVLYDQGVEVYLLGKANALTPVLLSLLVIVLVNEYLTQGRMTRNCIVHIIITTLSVLIMQSGTGIVGIAALLFLFLLFKNRRRITIFKIILSGSVFMNFGIVLLKLQYYFSHIISNVLHKDVTLSNRTHVWDVMFRYFDKHFSGVEMMIGTGMIEYKDEIYGGRYAHCHNQFFDQFIQSGLIGMVLYILLFYLALSRIVSEYRRTKDGLFVMFAALIVAYSVLFITEVYTTPLVILLLMIGYRSRRLIPSGYITISSRFGELLTGSGELERKCYEFCCGNQK